MELLKPRAKKTNSLHESFFLCVCQLFFKDHVVVSPLSKVDKSFGEKPKVAPLFSFEGGSSDNSANMTQQIQF